MPVRCVSTGCAVLALVSSVVALPSTASASPLATTPSVATASDHRSTSSPVHDHTSHDHGGGHGSPPPLPPRGERRQQRLRGTYQLLTTDMLTDGRYEDVYREIIELPDRVVEVHLPPNSTARPGDAIEIAGFGDDSTIEVAEVRVMKGAEIAAAAVTGVTSVLVILASWTGPDSVTQAKAQDVMFNQGNLWWKEVSYGQHSITGAVTPWVTIPAPSGGCWNGMSQLMSSAKSAAAAKGYNSANYTRTVVYFPSCSAAAGSAGWAYVPGTSVWLNGFMDLRVTIHEQGHNYGLHHAHSLACESTPGNQVPLSNSVSGCYSSDYGDPFDAMGGSPYVGHFNGPQKQTLGWLGLRKVDLGANAVVDLAPLESTSGTQVARITASASRSYWLEYRTAAGQDSKFPEGGVGVLVHMVDNYLPIGPHLLDMRPSSNFDFVAASLTANSSWTSPEGIRVKVTTITASAAHVEVNGGQPPPGVPTAPVNPVAKAGDASAQVTWTRPINDNGATVIDYTVKVSPGGAQLVVLPSAGTTTSATLNGLTNGQSYTFTVSARNFVGSSANSAPSAAITPNKDAPSVTVTAPSPGVTITTGQITLSAGVTPSPISGAAIASVAFYVDGRSAGTDTTAPYSVQFSTDDLDDGEHTVSAQVLDQQNRSARSGEIGFAFVAPKPSVAIVSPNDGDQVVADSLTIDLEAAPGSGGPAVDTVLVEYDGYNFIGAATPKAGSPGVWTIDWNLQGVEPGQHTLTATITDTADRTGVSAAVTIDIDKPGPTVSIVSPLGGTVFGDVNFVLDAAPSPFGGGDIYYVELLVDDTLSVGWDYEAPWEIPVSMRSVADGTHSFTAVAYNQSYLKGTSTPVTLTVTNPLPQVAITAPSAGATITGDLATLTAQVSPSPLSGSPISHVRFEVGNDQACYAYEPTTPGVYSCTWDSRYGDAGALQLRVFAVDNDGYESTDSRMITVSNPGPSVTITAPAAGSTKSAAFPVTMSTTLNPATSTPILYVELYVDNSYVGYDDVAPFEVEVPSYYLYEAGTHLLQARVYDQDYIKRSSNIVSFEWVQPAAPPGDLTGTPGSAQMALRWSPPLDDGGRPIIDYVVQYSGDFGDTWSTVNEAVSTTTAATVPGLVNGTGYYFRTATKTSLPGGGSLTSDWSAWFYGVPAAPPGKPTNVQGTSFSEDVYLSWDAPANDGGAFVSDYVVQYSTDAGTTWTTFSHTEQSWTDMSVTGLVGVPHVFRVAAVNPSGQGLFSNVSGSVTPQSTSYIPLAQPVRVADTRHTGNTIDGQYRAIGKVDPNGVDEFLVLPIGSRDVGVPLGAGAVVLNVTATQPEGRGFITVFPCGERPNTSSLNFVANTTVPNAVVARLDYYGSICIYSSVRTNVIVDVAGYFAAVSSLTMLDAPVRLMDSRSNGQTVDDISERIGLLQAGSVTNLSVAGRGEIGASAKSVVLNVTVLAQTTGGFITVFPCGAERPNASNLNYVAGQVIPNLVISKVGTSGQICLFTSQTVHILVDASGYYPSATKLVPLSAPARLVDTRASGITFDHLYENGGRVSAGTTYQVLVRGRAGVAAPGQAVVLNVTVVSPTTSGFITVFPCGGPAPNASNLNFAAGQTIPNAVIAKIGVGDKVCFVSSANAHLIVDVSGYFQ